MRNSVLRLSSILLVVIVGSILMFGTAMAQQGGPSPETAVSNTGGVLPASPQGTAVSAAPFSGSGVLAEANTTVDPAVLSVRPLESAMPGSVIGSDGRKQITVTTGYPNRAIVFLDIIFPDAAEYTCTGWFIGPRAVATAGHCVYESSDGGWASSITVYPGLNGSYAPYGYTTAYRLFSVSGWTTYAKPSYDYGIIQTNDALGNTVGWFGFRWQLSNVFPGTFSVRGYPGDKTLGTMWTMAGKVPRVTGTRLWYTMDTYGGQSGSPLYQVYGGVCCYGVGIHTYGVGLTPWTGYNSATRITKAVFSKLLAVKYLSYP